MKIFLKFMVIYFLAIPLPVAHATLGQQERSVEEDRKNLKAQLMNSENSGIFSVHEIASPGTSVREYFTANGTIFAVTWHGISHPDLSVVLGEHWSELKALKELPENRHPRGRRFLRLTTSTIVYQEGGLMKAVKGRAFLPALVPAGVTAELLP